MAWYRPQAKVFSAASATHEARQTTGYRLQALSGSSRRRFSCICYPGEATGYRYKVKGIRGNLRPGTYTHLCILHAKFPQLLSPSSRNLPTPRVAYNLTISPIMRSSSFFPSDRRLPPTWTCDQCQTSFSKSKLLEQHTKEMKHAGYRCAALGCGKTFTARTSWLSHKKGHTAARTACSKCSKPFKRKDHCLEHEFICGKHKRDTSLHGNDGGTSSELHNSGFPAAQYSEAFRVARTLSSLRNQEKDNTPTEYNSRLAIPPDSGPNHVLCEVCRKFVPAHLLQEHYASETLALQSLFGSREPRETLASHHLSCVISGACQCIRLSSAYFSRENR